MEISVIPHRNWISENLDTNNWTGLVFNVSNIFGHNHLMWENDLPICQLSAQKCKHSCKATKENRLEVLLQALKRLV